MRPPRRITPRSDRPAWKQVADDIRDQIRDGDLRPGDPLPSESDLASEDNYDVSMNTIRQAMALLRQLELVATEKGKGSYIRIPEPPTVVTLPLGGEAMIRAATDDECVRLDLPPGALVVELSDSAKPRVLKALGTVLRNG